MFMCCTLTRMKTCNFNLLLLNIFALVLSFAKTSPIPGNDKEKESETDSILDGIIKINENATKVKLFEGDIVPPETIHGINSTETTQLSEKRNVRRSREYLWRYKIVPYEIASGYSSYERSIIRNTIAEFHKVTCLTFKERTNEVNWIRFIRGEGCYSDVGRKFWRQGSQDVSLGPGCLIKGTIIHEIMHTLGFWHEQSRTDRNHFVEIFWENIKPGDEHNFDKYTRQQSDDLGIDYDYDSVMHYGKHAFSDNGKITLQAVGNPQRALGQRVSFSAKDIIEINALYDCQRNSSGHLSTWSAYGPCDDSTCFKQRQRFCSHSDLTQCPNVNRYGVQTEKRKCNNSECYAPIDGHWAKWSNWNSCNKECGNGIQNRTRVCEDPKPKHGGKDCGGNNNQERQCIIKQCGLGRFDCEFDGQNWCFWKNDANNPTYYYWRRISGRTPSGGTGPSGDHTSGTGHYLYTESSSPAAPNNKARLVSSEFGPTRGHYVRFWYHMYGMSIGALRVLIKDITTGKEKMIWELTGDQGNAWKFSNATVSSNNTYKVIFESQRGRSYKGDIGLDDISFKEKHIPDALEKLCNIQMVPQGCYNDNTNNRVFPDPLDTHRSTNVAFGYHNVLLSWRDYARSLNELLCDCATRTKNKGYKYFGLQYYGECWSSSNRNINFGQFGASNQCIDGGYQPCVKPAIKACIGRSSANFVYSIV